MTDKQLTPEQNYASCTKRLKETQKRLAAREADYMCIQEDVVDSEGEEKKILVSQLHDLQEEKSSLESEIRVLGDRRKAAYLQIYQDKLDQAKLEASDLYTKRVELAKALDGARHAKQLFIKNTAPRLNRPERETQLLVLNTELSRLTALINSGQQSYQRLDNSVHRAELDLQAAMVEAEKSSW